jgi:hypothetical protein
MFRHGFSASMAIVLMMSGTVASTQNPQASTERADQITKWKEQVSKRGVGEKSRSTVELADGSSIVITMKSGDHQRYRYAGSSETEVSVNDSYHKHWVLPKSEISLITRPPKKDSNANGALIGLGVGAAGGVAFGAAGSSGDSESAAIAIPILGVVGAGIGALTGALVDASGGDPVTEILYRAK